MVPWLWSILACGEPEEVAPVCDTEYAAVSVLRFGRAEEGVCPGFNLDGHVTSSGDSDGCGAADYVDAEGAEGIDSSFAGLLPILDATEAAALEPLVQDFINNGTILLLLEMSGFDEGSDPGCGSFRVLRGADVPLVGTDGFLLPGQTLAIEDASGLAPVASSRDGQGRFTATGFSFDLDVQIFDADIHLPISNGAARVWRADDGRYVGSIGGGFPYASVLDALLETNIDAGLKELLPTVLEAAADLDLDGDGVCESISVTLEVELVRVWLYPDAVGA